MCTYYDLNHHFCCFAFILEMIAPPDFVRWFLLKKKSKNSNVWHVNGFVMMLIYVIRSLVEFSLLYEMTIGYNIEFMKSPWSQIILHTGSTLIFSLYLTPYWAFYTYKQFYGESGLTKFKKISKKQI
jgi:hypothetical protein